MPPISMIINRFTKGELSEKLSGQMDTQTYQEGVSQMRNMITMPQGGAKKRPGTRYLVATGGSGAKARIEPFVVTDTEAFVVELTPALLRVFSDPIDKGDSAVASSVLPYSADEIEELQVLQIFKVMYIVHRSHAVRKLTHTAGTNFTLSTINSFTNNSGEQDFGSADNYPGAIAAWNGRVVWMSTIDDPNGVWVARPSDPEDLTLWDTYTYTRTQMSDSSGWADPLAPETETVDDTRDVIGPTNGIEIILNGHANDRIQWAIAQRDLIIGTSGGEWILDGVSTAQQYRVMPYTKHGSARFAAIQLGPAVVFLQRGRQKIREYVYQDANGAYYAQDLSFFAEHLLEDQLLKFAYQSVPNSLLYVPTDRGDLLVFSYDRMYGLSAWSKIEHHQTIEDVCVVPAEDGCDTVYLSVYDGSTRHLEKFDDIFQSTHIFMDTMLEENIVSNQITGMTELASTAVTVVDASGNVLGSGTVDGSGTLAITASDQAVTVGVLYTAKLKTMRLNSPAQFGTTAGQLKRVIAAVIRVYDSDSFDLGPEEGDTFTETISGFSGDVDAGFGGGWGTDGYIYIEQESSGDLMVNAIIPEFEV
jgi:hypothetical protein